MAQPKHNDTLNKTKTDSSAALLVSNSMYFAIPFPEPSLPHLKERLPDRRMSCKNPHSLSGKALISFR